MSYLGVVEDQTVIYLERPVYRGVDQLQLLHDVSQAVVIRVVGRREGVEIFCSERTGNGVPHTRPVQTAVTAARTVRVAHTVVENQPEDGVEHNTRGTRLR